MGSCLSTFTELYGIQHSNLKQKWFQGIMTCQNSGHYRLCENLESGQNFLQKFQRLQFWESSCQGRKLGERKKTLELKFSPPYSSLHIPDSSDDHVYVLRIPWYVYACTISNKSLSQEKRRRLHTGIIIFNIKKTWQIVQLHKSKTWNQYVTCFIKYCVNYLHYTSCCINDIMTDLLYWFNSIKQLFW